MKEWPNGQQRAARFSLGAADGGKDSFHSEHYAKRPPKIKTQSHATPSKTPSLIAMSK